MENASVQRGLFLTFRLFSLIRHALRRATFPVGEGDLRRGRRTEVLRIYAPVPPGRLRADVGCIDWYDCLQFVRGDGLQFQVQ